jgi:hypothetical protein
MADEHQSRGSGNGDDTSPPPSTPPPSIEINTCLGELPRQPDDAARPLAPQSIRDAIRCHRCGYILRGLKPDGRCPECSFPIRDSIAAHGIGPGRDGLIPLGWLIAAVLLPPLALVFLAAVAFVIQVAARDDGPASQVLGILFPRAYLPLTALIAVFACGLAAWRSRRHKRSRIGAIVLVMLIAYVVAWPVTFVILGAAWLITFH